MNMVSENVTHQNSLSNSLEISEIFNKLSLKAKYNALTSAIRQLNKYGSSIFFFMVHPFVHLQKTND